jgi:hypothetical protein
MKIGGKYAPNRRETRVKNFLFWLLAALASSALAEDVLLAPGASLTILDAADPSVRVILTAPPDAPLNLSGVLVPDTKESVYSIVTRLKLDAARGLARGADGSMSLSSPAASNAPTARTLQGGVMIFTAGKYVYYPGTQAGAAPAAPPPSRTQASPGRLLISKPGADKAQAERDIAECRRYAERAAAQFLRSADRVAMHNSAMHSCLKSFGYEIHAPAA